MNASFGVNDQDMSSSIGRVRDGMDAAAIALEKEGEEGAGRLPWEGGGDCGPRTETETGGVEVDCGERNTAEAGGQGTDAGGAPTSRKEAAERSVVLNEPDAGGGTGV